MKKVTSFTHLVTGEGDRIAYTYSEISESGEIVSQNNKANFIVTDADVKSSIDTINAYINNRMGEA